MASDIDKNHTTPSDYTIWIKNLKRNFVDRELKKFIEEQSRYFGVPAEIYSTSIGYDINDYVRSTREMARLKGLLLFVQDYRKNHDNDYPRKKCNLCCFVCSNKEYPEEEFINVEIENLEKRIAKFEDQAMDRHNQTSYAFLTFQKEDDAKAVIDLWSISSFNKYFCCLCMLCYNGPLTFDGVRLKIEKAPEPSDIIWENLSATTCKKYFRRVITALWTIILLAGCFLLVYITKITQRGYYKKFENKPTDERTYTFLFEVRFFSFLLSFCIVLINRAIAIIVRIFSSSEKHVTWTSYHQAVTNKLVLALVLNSVAILIWINSGNLDDLFLPYGLINDILFLLSVDAIAGPLTYIFSPIYIFKVLKRRKVKSLARNGIIGTTQEEANKLWENPEVDMAQRYANILKTLIISFIFAPLFPLGLLIGAVSVTIQYWTDKILLLRRHSRPRNFGTGMSNNMLN